LNVVGAELLRQSEKNPKEFAGFIEILGEKG
jgi:hypothetical protein